MRIAAGIIGLVLMLPIGAQALFIFLLAQSSGLATYAAEGAVGLGVAFLYLVAGALALGKQAGWAAAVFVVAALLAGLVGFTAVMYGDLRFWAGAALALALMCWAGRGTRQAVSESPALR